MTKQLLTILFVLFAVAASAHDIVAVGTATQVVNGKDTLLFFRDEIHLRSTLGDADWYATDGSLVASGTDEVYPDDGGYFLVANGDTSAPVYAFRYTDAAADLLLTVEPDCEATTLSLSGDTRPFRYTRPDGSSASYARACTINYTALAWNTEEWVDSAAQEVDVLRAGYYSLPAMYAATPITLCYDPAIRKALALDSACVVVEIQPDDVRAVAMQLTSLATARGTEGEKSNERNRPTSQTLIVGSEYSGPLEVAFYANPTPAVKFYRWAIYHGADLIATRQDEDIRYTFSSPGSYRVVCTVNNQYCTADSMDVTVNISESYLAVPNVFTPNGDGQNDEFRVAYRSLREFHIWVYNRWGHLVYESTDPAKGWDGMIGNRPAAEGAYYYVIRAFGTDAATDAKYSGKISYTKKKANADEAVIGIYQLSGDINLIRGKK